ncbi:MAG: response regulator [Pseudomonadota bacterium]
MLSQSTNVLKKVPATPAVILVVEDETNVAVVMEARLLSFGYVVCAIAHTGPEAVAYARQHQPDLVLMDILLADNTNGIEAAREIRNHSDIPIIYLTCLSDQAVLDSAIQTNPSGFLIKPYDNTELRSCIEIAMIKHRAAREREELIAQLEEALLQVKRLSGLLPICASCKKIRDKQGHWRQIEEYITTHSEAGFSHGICPQCARVLYPEYSKHKDLK